MLRKVIILVAIVVVVLVVVILALYSVMVNFVARPYLVPSESMEPTRHGCKGCAGEQVMGKALAPIGDPSTSLVIGPY